MTILAVILGVMLVIQPYFLLKAVKFGIKLANKPEEAAQEPIFDVKPKKVKKITDEERRISSIIENIDNYVGDSTNQKEVI
jgi:hypothetical protein